MDTVGMIYDVFFLRSWADVKGFFTNHWCTIINDVLLSVVVVFLLTWFFGWMFYAASHSAGAEREVKASFNKLTNDGENPPMNWDFSFEKIESFKIDSQGKASENGKIPLYKLPGDETFTPVVHFTGQGGTGPVAIFMMAKNLFEMSGKMPTIYSVDYSGYSQNSGRKSTESNLTEDAVAILKHVGKPSIVVGYSLGCAVSVAAIEQVPHLCQKLVLLNPFTKTSDVVPHHIRRMCGSLLGVLVDKLWSILQCFLRSINDWFGIGVGVCLALVILFYSIKRCKKKKVEEQHNGPDLV